ncbi:MAG: SDR family oxidoreductase [Candidatus Caenarcaniphilales bacterium]|nr:SDR family oxidoreductase [Candidatus Caenarcaniphilales bacterium]
MESRESQAKSGDRGLVLVTGGTGYVGARLIPRLLEADYRVRAISRHVEKLTSRSWAKHPNLEIYPADLLDLESLRQTMKDCDYAYYLIHSMEQNVKDFEKSDRLAAQNMVKVAELVGLKRIIYLGGLGGDDQHSLSPHLRSRQEVAKILKSGKVPVTVLRAAMIIGSGSASFEILRYLVDRLPVMLTPRWVDTPCQPIAIRNVLTYLVNCLEKSETTGRTFDIGGAEILTYRELMDIYAEEAGLSKRLIIRLPFFTPRLSSYWIHFVTPMPSSIAQPLAEGLRNPVICQDHDIEEIIPQELITCRRAIHLALERIKMQQVESHWTDAGSSAPPEWVHSGDPVWSGGTIYEDKRHIVLLATPDDVWQPLIKIGGETGWYYGDWLWQIRGLMDMLIGGVGLARGRRHPSELRPGDALDFWRVVDVQSHRRLLLSAEMKLPGQAVLEFSIQPIGGGRVELCQTARFLPKGLLGMLYWWAVTPLHFFVFNGMLQGIAEASGTPIVSGPEKVINSLSMPLKRV